MNAVADCGRYKGMRSVAYLFFLDGERVVPLFSGNMRKHHSAFLSKGLETQCRRSSCYW